MILRSVRLACRFGAALDHQGGQAGVVGLDLKFQVELAAGHADLGKGQVQRLVFTHPGEEIELLEDRLALQPGTEDADAGLVVVRFDHLQGHRIGAIGDLQLIAAHAVADRLVKGGFLGSGDPIVGIGSHLAAEGAVDLEGRLCRSPGLRPAGPGQGHDVGFEDPGPPVDAQQAGAAEPPSIGRVVTHSADPELRRSQVGIVFHPGNGPQGPAMDLGKSRLDRSMADLAIDAAQWTGLGQQPIETLALPGRSQYPATGGQRERCLEVDQGFLSQKQIALDHRDLFGIGAAPGPAFVGPQPVVIDGIGLADALEHPFVDATDHLGLGRILAGGPQPFLYQPRDGQRSLGADAGLHPQTMGIAEHVAEHSAGLVEGPIALLRIGRPGTAADHHLGTVGILIEEERRSSDIIAGFHRLITPARLERVGIEGGVAPADLTILGHIFFGTDPHRQLRTGKHLGPFRVGVQAEEVHAQLGHLGHVEFVVVAVPPVRPLEEVVEGLDTADREKGMTLFVELGQFQGHLFVGNDVAVQGEADTQVFDQLIGAVECADIVAADDQDEGFAGAGERAKQVVLGLQRRQGGFQGWVVRGCCRQGLVLAGNQDSPRRRSGIAGRQRELDAGAEVDIAADFPGRQGFQRRGVFREDDRPFPV